jgi:hypothetical protein
MVGCGSTEGVPAQDAASEVASEAVTTPEEGPAAEAPASARVFFTSPADGAEVTSPVTIQFGVEGMAVDPAGEIKENSGHHHLIINGGPIDEGTAVPANETHIHYGKGQTEAQLELDSGEYTLTMQFANGAHLSYGKPMSTQITLKVTGASEPASEEDEANKTE